jgi:hypothetical protein
LADLSFEHCRRWKRSNASATLEALERQRDGTNRLDAPRPLSQILPLRA